MNSKNKIVIIVLLTFFFKGFSQEKSNYLPMLFFKENSVEFDTLYKYFENSNEINDTISVLDFISAFIKKNPNIDIKVCGNRDKYEKRFISKKRMNKVYSMLIKRGVEKSRLKTENKSASFPYIEEKDLIKSKYASEVNYLRRFNRRVFFIIINK